MIAYDNSVYDFIGSGTTHTVAFTCTGTDLCLIVVINNFANGGTSSVTYNGVALTKINETATNKYSLWYLINPATGANNIVATYGSSGGGKALAAASYTGVKQTGNPDATTNMVEHTAGSSDSVSVTSVADQCWVIMGDVTDSLTTHTAGANTTMRTGTSSSYAAIGDSNGGLGAGAHTLNVTYGASVSGGIGGLSLQPTSVPSSGGMMNFFMN